MYSNEPPPGKKVVEAFLSLTLLLGIFLLIKFLVKTAFNAVRAVFSIFYYLLRTIFDSKGLAEEARQVELKGEEHRRNVELEALRELERRKGDERERAQLIEKFGIPDTSPTSAKKDSSRIIPILIVTTILTVLILRGFIKDENLTPNSDQRAAQVISNSTSSKFRLPMKRPTELPSELSDMELIAVQNALRGSWNISREECAIQFSDVGIEIGDTGISFYESYCQIEPTNWHARGINGTHTCWGEGYEWESKISLSLSTDGSQLVRRDKDSNQYIYHRCSENR